MIEVKAVLMALAGLALYALIAATLKIPFNWHYIRLALESGIVVGTMSLIRDL